MMSWNILAERLVSQEFFPYVKPEYLSYNYRIDIIVNPLLFRKDFSSTMIVIFSVFKKLTLLIPFLLSFKTWDMPIATSLRDLCTEF